MGGGVSLGTFSGSALTESLKLLLLYGQDEKGNPYTGIEVDGMSGSSAGAMSLAIMLRVLLDYKSFMKLLNIDDDVLIKELKEEYTIINDWGSEHDDKLDELKSLHIAQKVQYKIWVEELDFDFLLGKKIKKGYKANPDHSFGLLDTESISKIIRKYISNNVEELSRDKIKVISKSRLIFACSLTNLIPIKLPKVTRKFDYIQKKSNEEESFDFINNLLKSVASYEHSEVRIIDFVFKKDNKKPTDSKWVTFSMENEDKAEKGTKIIRPLQNNASWNILASSVIACGAFPLAFEPVLLKRYAYEFGASWESKFGALMVKNNKLDKAEGGFAQKLINEDNEMTFDYFNFPYIDGGTFNNEPIKEAFKIANYIDFDIHAETDIEEYSVDSEMPIRSHEEFDRLVLFVDPIVNDNDPSSNILSYKSLNANNTKFPIDFKQNSELNKGITLMSNVIKTLANQGSIKEEHKSSEFVDSYLLNSIVEDYLTDSKTSIDGKGEKVIQECIKKLASKLKTSLIPDGTRDLHVYLFNKIRQINNLKPKSFIKIIELKLDELKSIIKFDDKYDLKKRIKSVKPGIGIDENVINLMSGEFLKLFFIILSEISLGTIGKDNKAVRVGVTPHHLVSNKPILLPGNELAAFGGFTFKKARGYSFQYGKICSFNILRSNQFREYYNRMWEVSTQDSKPFLNVENNGETQMVKMIEDLNEIGFYKDIENYSERLYSSSTDKIIKRVKNMIKIGLKQRVYLGLSTLFTALSSILYGVFTKFLIGVVVKRSLHMDEKIMNKQLIPISCRIKIKDKFRYRVKYETNGNGKSVKKKLKYLKNKTKNENMVELDFIIYLYNAPNSCPVYDSKSSSDIKTIPTFYPRPYFSQKNNPNDPNLISTECDYVEKNEKITRIFISTPLGKIIPIDFSGLNNKDKLGNVLNNLDLLINPVLVLDCKNTDLPSIYMLENTTSFSLDLEKDF